MAKINEQVIKIKLSRLVRDNEESTEILNDETLMGLLEAIQAMAGENTLIELEE